MISKRPIKDQRDQASAAFRPRVRFLLFAALLSGMVGAARLYALQVSGHDKWRAIADDQHSAKHDIVPERGEILIRDGSGTYPIAVNRDYPTVYLSPKELDGRTDGEIASTLAPILGMDEGEILRKLAKRDDPYEVLRKRISDDVVAAIGEKKLPGVHIENEPRRFYPGGELASQVVGFVSPDDEGQERGRYGFEAAWNDRLQGQIGTVVQERDAAGRWISLSDRLASPAEEGVSVILTIDRIIQHEVEEILKASVEKHDADGGSIIVVDPATGRILAMASSPSFDPNSYSSVGADGYDVFMNPTVSFSYEPGSVMKPITMAIGIDEGKVSPETEYVDSCSIVESGYTIRNAEGKCYGRSSMTKVLEESINTGVIFVEKLVGNERFADRIRAFGFGERTGIGLPGELPGDIRNISNPRRRLEFYTASFGQGITTTPLQIVMAYAALANGGRLMEPQIVDTVFEPDGSVIATEPEFVRQVVTDGAASQIGEMLESVVENGHGKRAAVPGYRVGGKTGTAQVAKTGEKGYDDGLSIGTFVGYAPIGKPSYAVLVKIDNPKDVMWAESSAAPAFGSVMKFLLEYGKVEPTEEIDGR